ncbi:MAG TPA: hypothetical protein VJZ71_19095 [Phycisphaerae bacterium]|nr:hypothetical protein [Phycisphaerae bacterium]
MAESNSPQPSKSEISTGTFPGDEAGLPVCREALTVAGECGREQCRASCRVVRWVRRFGVAGFLFFLVKGLLWLIVPALVARGLWNS